ncbi:DUF1549 and DUF1553 domain-containing protein [Rhodopirellula sp. P2]|uniref:DUF1549 and DUF1553 domain-containing protein n=1 Tax=Rhodopirellula sp. P2 TaxID=2127060 RepID=UPI00236826C2|nr:DUF1549 and DUF1553 domain-containing protein [Rhodopirellula sp. P2]WDQ16478.1 DUF1549 and DUF1553 domain-containing protein [Rhodopirellula sp. P2]
MRAQQRTSWPISNAACLPLLTILCPFVIGTLITMRCTTADEDAADYVELPIDDYDRDHWAFLPLETVEVPQPPNTGWRRNPIDDFIQFELSQRGLQPQPPASRQTLIRRLSFDLTGLPPTPSQIAAFESDASEDAYERLVDRLLDSPRYGERWAQHWLDLARFAETDGFEHDKLRPDAWKYRDWVIAALNEDLPYDEFIRRQIAGDEMHPNDKSALTATRFCLSGPDMPDINLTDERRHTVLNELTSTIGEVFLGLQVGCAQCHDHKYDPISQADFYRLRAIFEPSVPLQKNHSLSTLKESFPSERPSHLMLRGDFRSPGPELKPGVIRVVSSTTNAFSPRQSERSAGLRTALADWLVAAENPMTARVMVNRVWQHHFGAGLSSTPSDFGVMGSEPSHPELLDWLALSFVQTGWSLKSLHRMIVTSATYRQRSRLADDATESETLAWGEAQKADPQAQLLSRYPRWRLEGEAIRDAMLVASGQINWKSGGPGVRPPLPQELVGTLLKNQWDVTQDRSEHNRRSIYVFARRNLRYPIFEVFDRPSANTSCSRRDISTTAPQSLHLLNSEFSLNLARSMASSIANEHPTEARRIQATFQRVLGRSPTPEEQLEVQDFLSASTSAEAEKQTHLCLALFNCNEFITVD